MSEQERIIAGLGSLQDIVNYLKLCRRRGWRYGIFPHLSDDVPTYWPPTPARVHMGFAATNTFDEIRLGQIPSDASLAALVLAIDANTGCGLPVALQAISKASMFSTTGYMDNFARRVGIIHWMMCVQFILQRPVIKDTDLCADVDRLIVSLFESAVSYLGTVPVQTKPSDLSSIMDQIKSLCRRCGGTGSIVRLGADGDCGINYCPAMTCSREEKCPECHVPSAQGSSDDEV